ncbi:hypothetical protein Sjap_007659 [Stephania japonica]|uniref:SBP-type domain-containing protein n=1 Tax=Stephania japonica TaxID=461633 RepID=A0AAP0PDX1_9MAGN
MSAQQPHQPDDLSGMDVAGDIDVGSATAWDWGNLLDFAIDDQLDLPWSPGAAAADDLGAAAAATATAEDEGVGRVRKRDPRLTCENFLAGRVPCACPELDELAAEAAAVEAAKKRARTAAAAAGRVGGGVRCQVAGCEADISGLKGYHKRHRVCLHCAYATSVFLDGQEKRYCQQCGKFCDLLSRWEEMNRFHTLPNFDEGKRSCRRKLEHHNKRRRRKPKEAKDPCDDETQTYQSPHQNSGSDEVEKEYLVLKIAYYAIALDTSFKLVCVAGIMDSKYNSLCVSNHTGNEVLESEDGHASPDSVPPSSQNIQSDVSFDASAGALRELRKGDSKYTLSPSFCDNKSAYSSVCPTGRISFKLYDWNPAEFPRRLRHQIFQWLASMPVELEGYIRPGCTILTVFITMPPFMWKKLQEEGASYIMKFIGSPESSLFGRGPMIIYLNDMKFHALKGGVSLMNVNMKGQAPRLHYVHPNCFESGKAVEFVACGSSLFQPKFRLLVSFCGRYLEYDHCLAISHGKTGFCPTDKEDVERSSDHQLYKVYIPKTEQNLFGPAFVEVENESGLSNFIPILFGDRQTCHEMQMVQPIFNQSLRSRPGVNHASCEELVLRQTSMSELLLDIAWLLKEPKSEHMEEFVSSLQIRRLNCVLDFLVQNECTILLEKLLRYSKIMKNAEKLCNSTCEINDVKLYQQLMHHAMNIVLQRFPHASNVIMHSGLTVLEGNNSCHDSSEKDLFYVAPASNQDNETMKERKFGSDSTSSLQESNEKSPLINKQVVMDVNCQSRSFLPVHERRQKSCGVIFSSSKSRPLMLLVAATVVCVGMCVVLLHPHRVREFAVSVRRCLFG